ASGSASGRKWRPSISRSVVTASRRSLATGSRAQSSPTPSTPAGAGHLKWRAIRSNSLAMAARNTLPAAGGLHFERPQIGSQFVEHAVHKLRSEERRVGERGGNETWARH